MKKMMSPYDDDGRYIGQAGYPGFTGKDAWGALLGNPCCPLGCYPCGAVYYNEMEHYTSCCQGGACASGETMRATCRWINKWLKAEKEWKVVEWLKAEANYVWDVQVWLAAEQDVLETLVPKKPLVVHKPRKENSPAKAKHVKAMQRHAS